MIRKGQKFTVSGQPSVYRAIAPQMSDAEYALGGWARDMYRRWVASGEMERRQMEELRNCFDATILIHVYDGLKLILDGNPFDGRCKNCEHWRWKLTNGICRGHPDGWRTTEMTDLCILWEKCKGESWAG